MVRLIKHKVDAKAIEYKNLMHTFINHQEYPFELDEAKKAFNKSIEIIKEFSKFKPEE